MYADSSQLLTIFATTECLCRCGFTAMADHSASPNRELKIHCAGSRTQQVYTARSLPIRVTPGHLLALGRLNVECSPHFVPLRFTIWSEPKRPKAASMLRVLFLVAPSMTTPGLNTSRAHAQSWVVARFGRRERLANLRRLETCLCQRELTRTTSKQALETYGI